MTKDQDQAPTLSLKFSRRVFVFRVGVFCDYLYLVLYCIVKIQTINSNALFAFFLNS